LEAPFLRTTEATSATSRVSIRLANPVPAAPPHVRSPRGEGPSGGIGEGGRAQQRCRKPHSSEVLLDLVVHPPTIIRCSPVPFAAETNQMVDANSGCGVNERISSST